MADKKPLVLGTDGVIEEIQSGDALDTTIIGEVVDLMDFTSAVALVLNDAVFVDSSGELDKAKADAAGTMPCRGFCALAAAGASQPTKLQAKGLLSGLSGMTPGAKQYVSTATAGVLVETVASTAGHYVQEVGVAKTASVLLIELKQPVKRG